MKSRIKYIFSGILFLVLIGLGDNFLYNSFNKNLIKCEWVDRRDVRNIAKKIYYFSFKRKSTKSTINLNSQLKRHLRIYENLILLKQNNQDDFFNYIIKTKNTEIVLLTRKESIESHIIGNL